jgi:hypothetical protein
MCSAEGFYLDGVKADGSKIKIFWWDLGDTVPWREPSRYQEPFPWTTVFSVDDLEVWSQVAKGDSAVARRTKQDHELLIERGVRVETLDVVSGGVPIPFEDRAAYARP